jgi:PAS domain S-box-containing protein
MTKRIAIHPDRSVADHVHSRPVVSHAALIHELHVHQAELESQNEELRRTQVDLAAARDRFMDLYDFAPVGYFTLDDKGVVAEVNLTGAALLGEERKSLLNRRFVRFIVGSDSDRWHRHLQQVLKDGEPLRIELMLQTVGGASFHGQIDCLRVLMPGDAVMVRITLTDVSQRKQAEMDRRIATATVDAREAERLRVARELHEDLGQRLSALKMNLASLPSSADQAARSQRIGGMLEALDKAVATVRRITTDLRPLMLDDLGLNAAIDWLARDSAGRLGIEIELQLDDNDPPLGERRSVALFRMLQESLGHIVRDASVNRIVITLAHDSGELVLSVQSNGTNGSESTPAQDGAMTLREQAHMLGGRIEFKGVPGGGRQITVQLPLTRDSSPHGQRMP